MTPVPVLVAGVASVHGLTFIPPRPLRALAADFGRYLGIPVLHVLRDGGGAIGVHDVVDGLQQVHASAAADHAQWAGGSRR